MTTEHWKLEKDLCRCCHSEGTFNNLAEPYQVSEGHEEVYSDMLKDSLNIDITPVPGVLCTMTYTICTACILRLKEASNFKKQVLDCEQRFRDMYNRNFIEVYDPKMDADVKVEVEHYEDDFKLEMSPLGGDMIPYKLETDDEEDLEEEKKSKSKKSKGKSKAKKSKKGGSSKNETADETKDEPAKTKKVSQPAAPKFYLRDDDYKKVGNVYHCTRCDKQYVKFFSLRFHVKSKHYKIPRYRCGVCLKAFMTQAPMTVHKLEEHDIDERFKCKACKGTFNTKVQLRKHINNFHMLGEKYTCDLCEYESFSFEGMYKHKFKHKTVKDYHCRFCRKSFLRKTTLDLHERIHTGDRRKVCQVCGQAFVQKASLNYHMTKYHPEVNY